MILLIDFFSYYKAIRTIKKSKLYLYAYRNGDKKGILLKLMDYAKQNSQQFKLVAITKEMQQEIEAVLPGIFEYIENRDFSDYVYKTESLITLAGKKLHAKRNHINKFKSTIIMNMLILQKTI